MSASSSLWWFRGSRRVQAARPGSAISARPSSSRERPLTRCGLLRSGFPSGRLATWPNRKKPTASARSSRPALRSAPSSRLMQCWERITVAAARVTGAEYAALGVIDPAGTALERFVTHGIDGETQASIGELPRGLGILGVLIRDARPLRLHDLGEDPESVGFPPKHRRCARSSAYRSAARSRLREPVPDREGDGGGDSPTRTGAGHAARGAGSRRGRERTPVRDRRRSGHASWSP